MTNTGTVHIGEIMEQVVNASTSVFLANNSISNQFPDLHMSAATGPSHNFTLYCLSISETLLRFAIQRLLID